MIRFFYLVAAYNEESQILSLWDRLDSVTQRFPGSQVLFLDNGSQDRTWILAQDLAQRHPGRVTALHSDQKGMGVAFRMGLQHLKSEGLGKSDWVVFAAADLPFGFSDLDGVLAVPEAERDQTVLFVGSKSHPGSLVARSWKRTIGSVVFAFLRRSILGIRTKDTQGSLFLRGDLVEKCADFESDDYFFSIEVVDRAERLGRVVEIPISLSPEIRPSRVRLLRDGAKIIRQLLRYRLLSRRRRLQM